MQYNKNLFGEAKDSLVTSPYFDDYGVGTQPPIDKTYLVAENGNNFITESGLDTFITEES
jgi:hypothetical protein